MSQPIRNAGATMEVAKIFRIIKETLVAHNATDIHEHYENKRMVGIDFTLIINGQAVDFRLPCRVEGVQKVMYKNTPASWLTDRQREQAYRTAWANVRDWLGSQCALLIDSGQADMEEVFLPYLIGRTGITLYEEMQKHQFLLPAPKEHHS